MGDLKRLLSMTPEERAAVAAGVDAPAIDNGQNYLSAPPGATLVQDADRNSSRVSSYAPPVAQEASLSGSSNPMARHGLGGTTPTESSYKPRPAAQETHKMSPDELYKYAQAMQNQTELMNSHVLAPGPSTGSRDDAGSRTPSWLSDYMSKQDTDL